MDNISNYVGVDIAKKDFYVCLNENIEPRKFNNTNIGINSFLKYLKQNNCQKDNTAIGVESTGSYHLRLCLNSTDHGYRAKVINPLIVKKQNQTDLRRVKNDKKDSSLIRYCLTNGAGYDFKETKDTIILKNKVRQRDRLSEMLLSLKRRQSDIKLKEDCIKTAISPVYQEIADIIEEKIKQLKTELKQYNQETQQLLQTIPGVGPITAVSFISEVGDIKRFKTPKQLTAYTGLDSRVHQSGTSINGKGYISKRGNKILRTRLYNAATVAVLHDNMFQKFFQKKRSEEKPYRVALVATMNKMVHVIWAVWTNKAPFKDQKSQE